MVLAVYSDKSQNLSQIITLPASSGNILKAITKKDDIISLR